MIILCIFDQGISILCYTDKLKTLNFFNFFEGKFFDNSFEYCLWSNGMVN